MKLNSKTNLTKYYYSTVDLLLGLHSNNDVLSLHKHFPCLKILWSPRRHLSEVQKLQTNQKQEIEELYVRKGKVPPPGIVSAAAILNHRPRRFSKTGNYPSLRKNSLQRVDVPPPAGWRTHCSLSPSAAGSTE